MAGTEPLICKDSAIILKVSALLNKPSKKIYLFLLFFPFKHGSMGYNLWIVTCHLQLTIIIDSELEPCFCLLLQSSNTVVSKFLFVWCRTLPLTFLFSVYYRSTKSEGGRRKRTWALPKQIQACGSQGQAGPSYHPEAYTSTLVEEAWGRGKRWDWCPKGWT